MDNVAITSYYLATCTVTVCGLSMNGDFSVTRIIVALLVALMCCAIVWLIVPYNNFVLNNTYLADSFLPEIVVGLLLVILLVVNPLLKLVNPGWMFSARQVALIASMLLFAAVIPSNGLMRMFPHLVAEVNQGVNDSLSTARIVADANLPQALFPDPLPIRGEDGNVQTFETPVSDQFIDELYEGQGIPWSAWVVPMSAWGVLILSIWMMMLGLGGVVYPQWRDRERLPFPLLNVYQSLTGGDDEKTGRAWPAMFYNRGFWIACLVVFLIHALRGLHIFTGAFPSFPLEWNLTDYYSDSIFRHSPIALKRQAIFFAIMGVAYFVPNRYAVSVWGWVVMYSLYITFGRAFVPAFSEAQVNDQSFGMLVAIAVWVIWLGRGHWPNVGRAMLGRGGGTQESWRDLIAGWMFVIGCAGMICWLYWVGCGLWWSILATAGCAMISLLMARIIAETGIPILWLSRITVGSLAALFPLSWQSANSVFFSGALYALVTRATAVSAAVMTTMALGMDQRATARHHTRVLLGGLVVLVIGFVVCGGVHLNMAYNYPDVKTAPKVGASTFDTWQRIEGAEYAFFTADRANQAVGLGIGSALLWACSRFPSWPIHPVGILFCQHTIGNLIWFSIFLGWLIKVVITSLFGGGAYRKGRPVFLGLILGELISVMVWTIVPVLIILWTGADPSEVSRYSLIQYP
jgi:hypothetical protein